MPPDVLVMRGAKPSAGTVIEKCRGGKMDTRAKPGIPIADTLKVPQLIV